MFLLVPGMLLQAMWRPSPYAFEARDFLPVVQAFDSIVYRSLEIDDTTFLV